MKIYFLFRKSHIFRILWGLVFLPAALIFRGLVLLRKLFLKKITPGIPTIGIGNLTVGGTGKTPFTIWLAKLMTNSGYTPVIFTTGYKNHAIDNTVEFGDETFEIKANFEKVSVISGRNRKANLLNYQPVGDNEVAILDDAFQQWGIKKKMEIILIDATFPFGNKLTLPAGILREPISSINRADIIILTHCDEVSRADLTTLTLLLQRKMKHNISVYESSHSISGFTDIHNNQIDLKELKGRKVFLISGIAVPESFYKHIQLLGCTIMDHLVFPDHHNYSLDESGTILKKAELCKPDYIIATHKDFVKLEHLGKLPQNFIYSKLSLIFNDEDRLKKDILKRI